MLAAPQERARAAMMRPHDVLGVRADASQAEVSPHSGPCRQVAGRLLTPGAPLLGPGEEGVPGPVPEMAPRPLSAGPGPLPAGRSSAFRHANRGAECRHAVRSGSRRSRRSGMLPRRTQPCPAVRARRPGCGPHALRRGRKAASEAHRVLQARRSGTGSRSRRGRGTVHTRRACQSATQTWPSRW